jgi:hypothetical protein
MCSGLYKESDTFIFYLENKWGKLLRSVCAILADYTVATAEDRSRDA